MKIILIGLAALSAPLHLAAQTLVGPPGKPDYGILVMAHGGSPTWNRSVLEAAAPIAATRPAVVAFGMADPVTLTMALDSLRALGVSRVAVVRLFISGQSFLPETRYLLGLTDSIPSTQPHQTPGSRPGQHHGGAARPVLDGLEIATGNEGLMDSPITDRILRDRTRTAGLQPGRTSVLLLAHGMGEERENRELLSAMDRVVTLLRTDGFHTVRAAALREDWSGPRAEAEAEVRAFAAAETEAGRTLLLVPYRLSGLGPYREVMQGFHYQVTDGILPHAGVTQWIQSTARRVACLTWSGVGDCGVVN